MGANVPGKLQGFSNRVLAHEGSYAAQIGFLSDAAMQTIVPAKDPAHPETELTPVITRSMAQQQGFTGDQCSHCQSMKMQVAGHCMVCADCGTTTGCS